MLLVLLLFEGTTSSRKRQQRNSSPIDRAEGCSSYCHIVFSYCHLHIIILLQMVQDGRHWGDWQVWRCQDCRQEEGPGETTVWRVSKPTFIFFEGRKGKIWSISSAPPNDQNAQHYKLQVRLTRQGGVGVERLSSGCQRLCLWRINKVTINVISIVSIVIITTILFNLSRSPRSDQTKTCPGLTWWRSSARWGKPWRQCVLALASPTSPLRRPVSTGDNALDNICWTNSRKVFYAFKETFLFSFPAEMLLVQCWEKLSAMENRCGLKSLRWPFQLQSEHSNRNDTLVSKSGVRKSYWFSR